MARTSTRGWKGCPMCKAYKDRAFGDPYRIKAKVLSKMTGKTRRVTRRSLDPDM